jgi:phosphohistidine phosphatase
VAAVLLAGAEAEWSVKKGGLWWLTRRRRDAKAQVVVRAVLAPELV